MKLKILKNVANPGCFCLSFSISYLPFCKGLLIIYQLLLLRVQVEGGKAPTSKNHHSVRSKDVFSYNVNQHRHLAEIYQSFPSLTDIYLLFLYLDHLPEVYM